MLKQTDKMLLMIVFSAFHLKMLTSVLCGMKINKEYTRLN